MKKNIGVIFGGRSAEHEVSIESAKTVVKNLGLAGYAVKPIYIQQRGAWRLAAPEALAKGGKLKGAKNPIPWKPGNKLASDMVIEDRI